MNIDVMKRALRALQYNSCYIDPVMAMDAITALKDAIKEAEEARLVPLSLVNDAAKAATASACNIPGMAKTTCPYCEQGFSFEYTK